MNHRNNGRPKRRIPKQLRRRKQRRITLLLVSLLLVFGVAVGATIAFIQTQTGAKKNTFVPSEVSCDVKESFDGAAKKDVGVENTGNTDAYIRVRINVTWMKNEDAADQTVSASVPEKGVDYTISYFEGNGWIDGGDGYWYYQEPVAPGAVTNGLIKSCTQRPGAAVPEGCHLSVEILASAIQASPEKVVSTEWNVELFGGEITKINGSGVTGE